MVLYMVESIDAHILYIHVDCRYVLVLIVMNEI